MDSGITVTGTGQAQAPADLLRIHLNIGRDAADVSAAVEAVAEQTEAVTAALSGQGVAAADLRTSAVNVYPHYGESMQIAGYRASHSLTVSTADLTGFGRLLKVAIDAIGNDLGLDQLTFDIADKSPLVEQARQSAFTDARQRAEHLAELSGRRLSRIESVVETRDYGPPVPMASPSGGRASADIAVAPGQQTVESSVTVRWAWDDSPSVRPTPAP